MPAVVWQIRFWRNLLQQLANLSQHRHQYQNQYVVFIKSKYLLEIWVTGEKETDVVIEHNGIHLSSMNSKQAQLPCSQGSSQKLFMFTLCNSTASNAGGISGLFLTDIINNYISLLYFTHPKIKPALWWNLLYRYSLAHFELIPQTNWLTLPSHVYLIFTIPVLTPKNLSNLPISYPHFHFV